VGRAALAAKGGGRRGATGVADSVGKIEYEYEYEFEHEFEFEFEFEHEHAGI
jgi:hypothetical protein